MTFLLCVGLALFASVGQSLATGEPVRVEAESFDPVPGFAAWQITTSLRDAAAVCPGGLSGGAALSSNDPAARMQATLKLPDAPHYVWVRRYADGRSAGAYPLTVEINGRAVVIRNAEPAGPAYVWEWWGRVAGGEQHITLRDPGSWSVAADCLVFAPDPDAELDGSGGLRIGAAHVQSDAGEAVLEVEVVHTSADGGARPVQVQTASVGLEGESVSLMLPLLPSPQALSPSGDVSLPPMRLDTGYLPRGRYDVVVIVRQDDATRSPAVALAGSLQSPGRPQPEPCRAEVRPYRGRPVLFVNGRPYFGMGFIGPRPADVAHMGRHGVRFMNLGGGPPQRDDAGGWDFRGTDTDFLRLVCIAPRAYYFPRVFAGMTAGLPAHERALMLGADGTTTLLNQPSFASETWLNESEARFRALAEHIVNSPYADRVIGLHLCAGDVGEWFQWSEGGGRLDVGPAMRAAFGRWLRNRYRTQARLRATWDDPGARFAEPPLPTVGDLWEADGGGFRDPRRRAAAIDFMRCYNDVVVQALERFAKAVKEGSDGRLLTGAFFGYTFGLHHWVAQTSGHLGTQVALRSPYIDFFSSPCGYGDRGVGGVSIYNQGVWASQALHGKLFYGEADIRTHLCSPDSPQASYRSATTSGQSVALLQREFANCLAGGKTLWWFDMDGGWFSEAPILRAIRRMSRIGERSLERDYRSVAEVAVVVDPQSWLYKAPKPEFDKALTHSAIEALARLGAPWDAYLLDDLGDPRVPDYRMYLFLNAFHLTQAQREMVARKVKRGGATSVWVYAPGSVDDTGAGPEACRALTGLRLSFDEREDAVLVETPWGRCGNPDPQASAPLWYCADPDAEVLGRLQAGGQPGLVRKQLDDWVSVYSSAPLTDHDVLRRLAREAGVHIYCDQGDAFYMDNRYFSIHAGVAGPREITFARPVTVVDLWTAEVLCESQTSLRLQLPQFASGLYEYRPVATEGG